MSGQDLYLELQSLVNLLNQAVKQYGNRGRAYAQAEQDYRIALAKEILIQRDNGVPVTIVNDICRGKISIAKLKFERDAAEVVYKAAGEAINSYKLQIKVIEGQIQREYGGNV